MNYMGNSSLKSQLHDFHIYVVLESSFKMFPLVHILQHPVVGVHVLCEEGDIRCVYAFLSYFHLDPSPCESNSYL